MPQSRHPANSALFTRPLEPPWPSSPVSTKSSPSPATAGSSSRRARSTADPARRGTTAHSARSSRRTSAASGGRRSSAAAATWWAWTPRSSCPKRVWEASGHVATFTDPLVECLNCHRRFRADNLIEDFEARKGRKAENGLADVPCPNCGVKGQYTEPKAFSGLDEDLPRRRRRRVRPALPAPRDRAGHLRQLRQRRDGRAQEAAVRRRPGRQGVPQRDHPRQLHLPHARVRADGDRVLRAARRRAGVVRALGRGVLGLVRRPRRRSRAHASLRRVRRKTARTTPPARSTSSTSSGSRASSGASSWASRTAPTTT